ncbi:MAG TPA: N-acetylglucosamine-6-phosphate deacetylase [Chloroflexota bacterium]|nr:N-acetylglucosamine-6-phosphate deacetylase [Chloroflexota bacterium]
MTVIRHATIYTADTVIPDGTLRIIGDRIAVIGTHQGSVEAREAEQVKARGELDLDGRGLVAIPGLIDLQCNGIAGYDVLDADPETIRAMVSVLPRYGCTAVLPTIVTAAHETLTHGLRAIAQVSRTPGAGTAILGTHMEGPWLSPAHRGAHQAQYLRPFDRAECAALLDAAQGTLRLVTLAPEVPGNAEAVQLLAGTGTLVSLGHSGADYDAALSAARHGARMATHLFNAMGPLHHRAPGLAGAALTIPGLVPGIIPDGHHLHPAIVRLAARARGPYDLVVVTDSVPVAGTPPGLYTWQDRQVHWDGETVRLSDGTLAGSGLTPIEALRRYISITGLSLAEALPAMTSTPARLLGQEGIRGTLAPGARGDVVLLTQDLQVHTTLVGGEVVYQAAPA